MGSPIFMTNIYFKYFPENRKSKETDFIALKKYYQRIYKKTGNEYKKWLQQIDENEKAGRKEENTLYIFGHSLDVTDGDVLREFINHDNLKTVIFYRNQEQLGQQIANLVKILNSDDVIEKVYGNNPVIEFRQQRKRELITGSAFEITSDTMQFKTLYKWSNIEAEKLIVKLRNKMLNRDLKYFYSQKAVITLFDVLQKNGLEKMYGEQLLKIAYELMKSGGLWEPEQFEAEDWSHQNYDDSFECDLLTRKFIDLVNAYNRENFPIEEGLIAKSSEEGFMRVQQLLQQVLDAKEKVTKENYIELLHFIFDLFDNKHENIEKLWNILLKISRGPAEKVAKNVLNELIGSCDNELNIIRCNYLLSQIQMNEYFDMKAEEMQESSE